MYPVDSLTLACLSAVVDLAVLLFFAVAGPWGDAVDMVALGDAVAGVAAELGMGPKETTWKAEDEVEEVEFASLSSDGELAL